MSLSEDLLHLLDDDTEPLSKRLKIADNAFKSVELPLVNKEVFLIKWLSKVTKTQNLTSWELLLKWLKSTQLQSLGRNEISHKELQYLLDILLKRYKREQHTKLITECVFEIIQNKTFQLFFKHHVFSYCNFVTGVLSQLKCSSQLSNFLSSEQLFHKQIMDTENFTLIFLTNILPVLSNIVLKFSDKKIFIRVSKVVGKCVFEGNLSVFSQYFDYIYKDNGIEDKLPKYFFEYLLNVNAIQYKLVFHAFSTSCNNFGSVYSFFGILLQILGFKMYTFFESAHLKHFCVAKENSVLALKDLCDVLCEKTCDFSLKLNGKCLTECFEYIICDSLNSAESYQLLIKMIKLQPLVMKTCLGEVLQFALIEKNCAETRETFLLELFEVFAKLRRILDLVNATIDVVKKEKPSLEVNLPAKVLECYSRCITTFAGWQVFEMFKILLIELNDSVNHIQTEEEYVTSVEFVSTFLCQFLMSVRIVEHTFSSEFIKSFAKSLLELKNILRKFGTTLVQLEHNPRLMRTYLNLCRDWGDLCITLDYYGVNDELVIQKNFDNDCSATNLTYIHSYLTREQWRLISQRITNFGEKPCRQAIQKLCLQKLKAMHLFERSINTEVTSSVATSILTSLDDQDVNLLFHPFVLKNILPSCRIDNIEVLVEIILDNGDIEKLQLMCNNPDGVEKIFYAFMCKMNKTFTKYGRNKAMSTKILNSVSSNLWEVAGLRKAIEDFKCEQSLSYTVNETELNSYLDLIFGVPLPQIENHLVIEILFLYVVALRVDLKKCELRNVEIASKCENFVLGISQSLKLSEEVIKRDVTKAIIDNFNKYEEVFNYCMQCVLRNRQKESFCDVLDFLTQNIERERYTNCAIIFLTYLERCKISKLPENLLYCQEQICNKFFCLVQKKDRVSLIEPFTFALKFYLFKNDEDHLQELLSYLDDYVDAATNSDKYIEGSVFFFTIIIKNKAKCRINSDTITKIWTRIYQLQINEKQNRFNKLVELILPYVSEETFFISSSELLSKTDIPRTPDKFSDQLRVWISISTCSLSSGQIKIWQSILEDFLYREILPKLRQVEYSICEDVIKLQVTFVQNVKALSIDGCVTWYCIYASPIAFPKTDLFTIAIKIAALSDTTIFNNLFLPKLVKSFMTCQQKGATYLYKIPLSASLLEATLLTVSLILKNGTINFIDYFNLSLSLLDSLIKHRKTVLADYLPMYLQRYRNIFTLLSINSNSNLKLNLQTVQELADCAHKFEKLTKALVSYDRTIMRICPNLIADILKQFERISIYHNVKIHLNNCLYQFMSLCDEHSVAYLKRALGTASTEMFKIYYENYNKYYKYTGKV